MSLSDQVAEPFDPATAIETLEFMAQLASTQSAIASVFEPTSSIVRAAAGLLEDTRSWLSAHRVFAGEALLRAAASGAPVAIDDLVEGLREAAAELSHARRRAELWRVREAMGRRDPPREDEDAR